METLHSCFTSFRVVVTTLLAAAVSDLSAAAYNLKFCEYGLLAEETHKATLEDHFVQVVSISASVPELIFLFFQ